MNYLLSNALRHCLSMISALIGITGVACKFAIFNINYVHVNKCWKPERWQLWVILSLTLREIWKQKFQKFTTKFHIIPYQGRKNFKNSQLNHFISRVIER